MMPEPLNPEALEPMYRLLKRINRTPDFLMVLFRHVEIDRELHAALKLAEGK